MTPIGCCMQNSIVRWSVGFLFLLSIVFTHQTVHCHQKNQRATTSDDFHEDLYIKPLADGKLFAHFQFRTLYRKDLKSLRWENKIEIFPLAVIDLIANTDLRELHFSLTKGNWDYKNWGYPVRSSPPGALIRAKFSKHNEDPNRSWRRLVNSLAGKFCTSLVSADHKTLVETKLSLDKQSLLASSRSPSSSSSSSSSSNLTSPIDTASSGSGSPNDGLHTKNERILYSNLPEETLCTENLTPWKKILPCYSDSGLASLLNAVNLFQSSHSSLSIDLEPVQCLDQAGDAIVGCEQVQLKQSMSVVFNPLLQLEWRQRWSLASMFGKSLYKLCPLSSHSKIHVDISNPDERSRIYPQNYKECSLQLGNKISKQYATFDMETLLAASNSSVQKNKPFNLGMNQTQIFKRPAYSSRPTIPVYLRTHIAGLGTADGTMVATVTNILSEPIRVTYMDVVPYFMRAYLHTLMIRTSSGQELKPDKLNFNLSKGETPTLIEFSLVLPANSETHISYDFERAFLRWTDFRPDANKGVLLGSAMISIPIQPALGHLVMPLCATYGRLGMSDANSTVRVELLDLEDEMLHIYAKPLLVILPTPDFSMPYNVLCLVSTVLVSAFGPIHNMTTRKQSLRVRKDETRKQSNNDNDRFNKKDD